MITVIGNLKGGSGKSTVTFNLAVWLATRGVDVITFDLDPQATLSDVVEIRDEDGHQPPVRVWRTESDPVRVLKNHTAGEALVDVGASNLWAMRQAIQLADRILIPVPPSQADVWSTQRFLKLVQETLESREERGKGGKNPELLLFVNRADTHPGLRESEETEEALRSLPGGKVLTQRICQRTIYRRSFSEGRAVFELDAGSKAVEEFTSFAMQLYPKMAAPKAKKKTTASRTAASATVSPAKGP